MCDAPEGSNAEPRFQNFKVVLGCLAPLVLPAVLLLIFCAAGKMFWVIVTTFSSVLLGLPVLGSPVLFFRKCRKPYGVACVSWGVVSAFIMLGSSFLCVTVCWGKAAAIIGTLTGLVPLIPMGLIAAVINGNWSAFLGISINLLLIPVAFYGGSALVDKK